MKVMGDNLAADDRVACARWMEGLGVDFIVHHIGYDERRMITGVSPMDELDAVVRAVSIPVQAVGGLSIRQAIECPSHGAPLVVLGAPLVIDADGFKPVTGARLRDSADRDLPRDQTTITNALNHQDHQITRSCHHAICCRPLRPRAPGRRTSRHRHSRDRRRRCPAARRRGVGLRIRRAPGVQHAFVDGQRPRRPRPRVRRNRRTGRTLGEGVPRR